MLNQNKCSVKSPKKQFQKEFFNVERKSQTKNSILNYDLSIQFCEISLQKYSKNRKQNQQKFNQLNSIKQNALSLIKHLQFDIHRSFESSIIEEEDCQKLMNFIIGGYESDELSEFLSLKYFSEKKHEFEVLNSIYKAKEKKWLQAKRKKSQIQIEKKSGENGRSLRFLIELKESINKINRGKIEQIMKKNKVIW